MVIRKATMASHLPVQKWRLNLMRFRMLISSSIITLILLTTNSYAILDPSEIGSSGGSSLADTLIEQSQGSGILQRSSPGFPASPFESRKLQENKSLVWTPMPTSLYGGKGKNPKQARAVSEDLINAQNSLPIVEENRSVSRDQINAQNSLPIVEENRVAGSWSLVLNDTESRKILLTLFQIEDAIFGSGSIEDGDNTFVEAAASGKMNGDKLDLDVISLGTLGLYRLSTTFSNDAVSGTYKAYSANGQIGSGDVQSTSFLPMS
jgi:hypothetical protein